MATDSQQMNEITDNIRKPREQSHLLVFGFVNQIRQTLSDIIIPTSIVNLCDKFHFINIDSYKTETLTPKIWYENTRKVLDENNYLLAIELAKYFITHYKNKNDTFGNVYCSLFYNIIALTYEDLKLPQKSEIYYKYCIKSDAKTDVWLWNYSELLTQQSRYNEAKDLLTKAVELKPNRLIYLFALAETYEYLNQHNTALEHYQKIVSKEDIPPDNGKNCLFKAVSALKLGNANNSQNEYEKYCKVVDKQNITGNTRYAILLYGLQKYDESLEYLTNAIECNRDTAFTYCYIGLIMKHKKRFIDAKCAFEQALDLCPIYPNAKTELKSLELLL